MQYIITFLLVTGTTCQIMQSDVDNQFQNTGAWINPKFKEGIMWLKDIAIGTTSDIMNISSDMKDKIISAFTVKSPVPNTEMVKSAVSEVKIVTTQVTTDNGEVIIPSLSGASDSKSVIVTKETETTVTSQP